MAMFIVHHHHDPTPLLFWWIIVVVLVAVIGYISQEPPVRSDQSYIANNQKTQYITIGGASQTKTEPNG